MKTPRRTLIVDDDPAIGRLAEVNLARNGDVVDTAQSGSSADALLLEHRYDLIIVDSDLPEKPTLRGYERLRVKPETRMSGFNEAFEFYGPWRDA